MAIDVTAACRDLLSFVEKEGFKGYDPYDALNSPLVRLFSFKSKPLRIGFIQLLKRIPFNLRPLLFISKGYNPKGLGLFLSSYVKLYRLECGKGKEGRGGEKEARYLERIEQLIDLLEGMRSPLCSGHGWGYNFDWQSRAFFVPKNTPTIVNSSFVGHALLDAWEYTGIQKARDLAIPIKDFILKDLNRYEEKESLCFSYTPLDQYFVHNANLLGASLLIRLYEFTRDPEVRDTALAALAYSMKHQREDGSWYYAEKEGSHWIDSFHTGFNLQAIKVFLDRGYDENHREAFELGVAFYAGNFFLGDGTPKYYHDRVYPIDIHSPAQALVFFSNMGQPYWDLTTRVINWMVGHLRDSAGYFYFQKRRRYTNRIPYIRWGQAWALHALTEYRLHCRNEDA